LELHRKDWLRTLLKLIVAASSFAICTSIVGLYIEPAGQAYHQLRLMLREHPIYDTLFFGTSQINYHVDTQLFDNLNARADCPTHSWNLGVAGQDILSIKDVFRTLLHSERKLNIRTVFIEPAYVDLTNTMIIDKNGTYEPYMNVTTIEKTTLSEMVRRFELVTGPQRTPPAPINREKIALGLAKQWLVNVTHAGYLNYGYFPTNPQICEYQCVAAFDMQFFALKGYRTLEGHGPGFDPAWYEGLRQWANENPAPPNNFIASPEFLQSVRDVADLAQAYDATPIIIAPPTGTMLLSLSGIVRQYHVENPSTLVLNYADPREHPELYEGNVRWDNEHLNEIGAKRFTEELSADFIRYNPTGCAK
jgi:hypothetical protein